MPSKMIGFEERFRLGPENHVSSKDFVLNDNEGVIHINNDGRHETHRITKKNLPKLFGFAANPMAFDERLAEDFPPMPIQPFMPMQPFATVGRTPKIGLIVSTRCSRKLRTTKPHKTKAHKTKSHKTKAHKTKSHKTKAHKTKSHKTKRRKFLARGTLSRVNSFIRNKIL